MSTLLASQQALLQALFGPVFGVDGLEKYIADNPIPTSARGLKSYQSNAHMLAERVLVAAYPVVTAILSPESMGQLARALWHRHPPVRGDLARWGADLPGFIAASPQLAELPWLADVARIEWALHTAATAANVADGVPASTDLTSLALLTTHDPDQLTLTLAAGTTCLALDWTATRIVLAHLAESEAAPVTARALAVNAALPQAVAELGDVWAVAQPEQALVWRPGPSPMGRPLCRVAADGEAGLLASLQAGQPLLAALQDSPLDWAAWLPQAIGEGLVLGARPLNATCTG
jgi:hypothetical protein